MTHVEIEESIDAPAAAVWECFFSASADDIAIGAYAESVTTKGEGEGAIRTTVLLDGVGTVVERLDLVDEKRGICRYTVLERGPLPFDKYTGQISVTPVGAITCILKLQGDFVPIGLTEKECKDIYYRNNYGVVAKVREMLGLDN